MKSVSLYKLALKLLNLPANQILYVLNLVKPSKGSYSIYYVPHELAKLLHEKSLKADDEM